MKPKLIAPRMTVREMVEGPDLERMLASGSWYLATKPKKPSRHLIAQNEYMQRRIAAGYKNLKVLLPEPVFNELRLRLREGETFAELVERLLSIPDNDQVSMVDAQK